MGVRIFLTFGPSSFWASSSSSPCRLRTGVVATWLTGAASPHAGQCCRTQTSENHKHEPAIHASSKLRTAERNGRAGARATTFCFLVSALPHFVQHCFGGPFDPTGRPRPRAETEEGLESSYTTSCPDTDEGDSDLAEEAAATGLLPRDRNDDPCDIDLPAYLPLPAFAVLQEVLVSFVCAFLQENVFSTKKKYSRRAMLHEGGSCFI